VSALFALFASALWGVADFLGGTATRRLPAYAVIGASELLALLLLVPYALLAGGLDGPIGYLPWAVGAGLVGLLALAAFYTALAAGTMGVVAPIAATGVVVPVLVGLSQGDSPSPLQVIGIGTVVVGVIAVSGQHRRGSSFAGARPILLALLAAAGFGMWAVCMARGARFSVAMTLVTMRLSSIAVIGLGLLVTRQRTPATRADLPLLAAIGASEAGANAAYAVATLTGALSVAAVLASLYPAVTVLLARQLHGERLRRVQLAGVVATLVGVTCIATGGGP
jgi:drug/metabolite transporter (DMT)-like permease